MSDEDDFEEIPEEEQPEKLRQKWSAEEFEDEFGGRRMRPCPHCGKWIDKKSFSCIYCTSTVFEDSGFLGRMVSWVKNGRFFILIILAIFVLLFVMVKF